MSVLQGVALVLAALVATAVVLVREPKRQAIVYMIFGLVLAMLFALLQAPDVALSEMAVGSVAIPFAILLTLVHIAHGRHVK
jgi:uncharacterized MnhB-related membrane protein